MQVLMVAMTSVRLCSRTGTVSDERFTRLVHAVGGVLGIGRGAFRQQP